MTKRPRGNVNLIVVLVTIVAAIAVFYFNRVYLPADKTTILVQPPPQIEHFTFGYGDVISDSLWIRVIQNFDGCGAKAVAEVYDYSKGVDLSKLPLCNYSWVYQMINSVVKLSPRFYMAYYYGGMNLSYLVNDVLGAKDIYEKGLVEFPRDLSLLFSAAYHYLDRVKDEKRASVLLLGAVKEGAPPHLLDLAAKLFLKEGRLMFAKTQLEKFIPTLPPGDQYRIRLEMKLESVNKEILQLAAKAKKK